MFPGSKFGQHFQKKARFQEKIVQNLSMHVDRMTFQRNAVLWGNIAWFEIGKQNLQAKKSVFSLGSKQNVKNKAQNPSSN